MALKLVKVLAALCAFACVQMNAGLSAVAVAGAA
jgi:hypothetical protein